MKLRKVRKKCLLYPEDTIKVYWDLFITAVLLITCMTTPFRLAFGEIPEPVGWIVVNYTIDICFLIDIFVIFHSAFYDSEYLIVEDKKEIAHYYMTGWLCIDLLAIIPFDLLLSASANDGQNFNDFARVVRLGRIARLIKMTRLLRILKIVKERSKLLKYLTDILKIGLGFERLLFFLIIFLIMSHMVTCIQVIAA